MRQEELSERRQAEIPDSTLYLDRAETEPAHGRLHIFAAVQETVEQQFSGAGLLSRDFYDLGTGTPRLERASAAGCASWLVAGRGQVAPATLATLQREYAFRSALHENWAAVPMALVPHGEGALLVLKDPGGELLRRTARPVRNMEAFVALALQLTAAVQAMHAAGVMHRALTPDRLLCTPGASAYLTGFGYAARLDADNGVPAEGSLAWDEDSFDYMAPELGGRMNIRVDARADLYSLGCILYELLAGRPPSRAKTLRNGSTRMRRKSPARPANCERASPRNCRCWS